MERFGAAMVQEGSGLDRMELPREPHTRGAGAPRRSHYGLPAWNQPPGLCHCPTCNGRRGRFRATARGRDIRKQSFWLLCGTSRQNKNKTEQTNNKRQHACQCQLVAAAPAGRLLVAPHGVRPPNGTATRWVGRAAGGRSRRSLVLWSLALAAPSPRLPCAGASCQGPQAFLLALTASTSCATLLALVLIRESFGVANDTLATSAQGGASAMTPPKNKKREKRR